MAIVGKKRIKLFNTSTDRESLFELFYMYFEEDMAARSEYQHQEYPTTINIGGWKRAIYIQGLRIPRAEATPLSSPQRDYSTIVRRNHGWRWQWMEEEAQRRARAHTIQLYGMKNCHHQLARLLGRVSVYRTLWRHSDCCS